MYQCKRKRTRQTIMAYKSFCKCVIFATLMLFVSTASGTGWVMHVTVFSKLCLTCANSESGVCTRTLYRRAWNQQSFSERYSYLSIFVVDMVQVSCEQSNDYKNNVPTYNKNSTYRFAYRTAYRTGCYTQAYNQDYCCPGYIGSAPHCQREWIQ